MIPPFLFQIYANAKNRLIPLKNWQEAEEKLCRNYQIILRIRDASAELKVKNHHTVGMTYFLRRR